MAPDPPDERAVEAAARALCREQLSLDLDKLKGEPRSAIYRETRTVLAAYFAALDPEVLVERIYRRLDGGGFGTTSKDCIKAVLYTSGLFNPDTEEPT